MRITQEEEQKSTTSCVGCLAAEYQSELVLVIGSLLCECVALRVSDLFLDKGVLQSLVDADAFGWV